MKRRDFLTKTGIVAATAVAGKAAAAASTPYGRPSSLRSGESEPGQIGVLAISRSGLSPTYWTDATSAAYCLVQSALAPDDQAIDNTNAFLRGLGLHDNNLISNDDNVAALILVNSTGFKSALRAKDYDRALDLICGTGGNSARQGARLQVLLEELLSSRAQEIFEDLESITGPNSTGQQHTALALVEEGKGFPTEDDLALARSVLQQHLRSDAQAMLVAVSVAAILVTAAAYVVVWVAVGAWVWVSGLEVPRSFDADSKFPDQRISQLDQQLMSDHERALTIARLTGSVELAGASMRRLIALESEAIVAALRNCRLLKSAPSTDNELARLLTSYGCRAAGLQ